MTYRVPDLRAALATYRWRDRNVGPVTEAEWRILLTLAVEGRCSVSSAALASGRAMTTGLRALEALTERGLIVSIAHRDDRRSRLIELSQAGREMFREQSLESVA